MTDSNGSISTQKVSPAALTPVVIVTGMSGAGRSASLKALEDLGYEAVDNLPISLLTSLVKPGTARDRPLAVGVDVRTRDFGPVPFLEELDGLIKLTDFRLRVLFLDCDTEILRRRFSETRRRHPVAPDRPLNDGIKRERRMLEALRDRADEVIDTSELAVGELKDLINLHFAPEGSPGLAIFVTSFAYRRGLPREADFVFDVRFLKNPYYQESLKTLSGLNQAVGDFIERDPDFQTHFDNLTNLLGPLLPRFVSEGKSYLTIAIGCSGGKHRSVFVAERLRSWLHGCGEQVRISHRDLHRTEGLRG